MPDGSAFMDNYRIGSLELFDDLARTVACCFDCLDFSVSIPDPGDRILTVLTNFHSLINDHLGICTVIGRHDRGEKCKIHPKWLVSHGSTSPDLLS